MVELDGIGTVFVRDPLEAIIREYPAPWGGRWGTGARHISYLGCYRAIGIGEPGDR
jgi:hypothetical protein